MKKKTICLIIVVFTALSALQTAFAEAQPRYMEDLKRGAFAAAAPTGGVYLSWRLLGTEPMDTRFNVYKNGALLVSELNNTNYTDSDGTETDEYAVAPVINGTEGEVSDKMPMLAGMVNKGQESVPYAYFDVPLSVPPGGTFDKQWYQDPNNAKVFTLKDTPDNYTYSPNDASVGDVDGDGEYEIVLKWDPSNSRDNSQSGFTGNVYIDCCEFDGTLLWRIDLGRNVRAGAHYTQFQVYDYDCDGKAEVVMRTAPGSKDGAGKFVTAAGISDEIRNADNAAEYANSEGQVITGPEYLTVFCGETGEAVQTVPYEPARGSAGAWGDGYGGRSERFLAGTAYLDGVHPSMIFARGYYMRSSIAAYNWDGENLTKLWLLDSGSDKTHPFYGQGNHNLSVADLDGDGLDEIIYGSAAVDDDGTVAHSTGWGHGDALHVSDFDNDGKQEIFAPLEEKPNYGIGFREADGTEIWHKLAKKDDGRGIMDNFSKKYGVLAWDNAFGVLTIDGSVISSKGSSDSPSGSANFGIYWDGDLLREHLDGDRIQKFDDGKKTFKRLLTLNGVEYNNTTKRNPCLQADLFGDWREEVIVRRSDNKALRVFTSLCPSEYKFTTFMHDSQYRCAVAWQNTAYNQPPHQSYFIGYEKDASEYVQPNIIATHTVPKDEYVINSVAVTDGNPVVIVTKNREGTEAAELVVASYDKESGVLTAFETEPLRMSAGGTVSMKFDMRVSDGDNVSAYIWNGFDEIVPLAGKKSDF